MLSLVSAAATSTTVIYKSGEVVEKTTSTGGGIAGGLFAATALMIVFRQRYPRWWFDFVLAFNRFGPRVGAYFALLTDRYPSTEDEQTVHLDLHYPDAREGLNRSLPLVKWLLALPHHIVLLFLGVGAVLAVVIAWFAILFTGRYPCGLFDYVVGVGRWRCACRPTPSSSSPTPTHPSTSADPRTGAVDQVARGHVRAGFGVFTADSAARSKRGGQRTLPTCP